MLQCLIVGKKNFKADSSPFFRFIDVELRKKCLVKILFFKVIICQIWDFKFSTTKPFLTLSKLILLSSYFTPWAEILFFTSNINKWAQAQAHMKIKLLHRQTANNEERNRRRRKNTKIMFGDGEWTEKWTWNWYTQSLASRFCFLRYSRENSLYFLLIARDRLWVFLRWRRISLHAESTGRRATFKFHLSSQKIHRNLAWRWERS